MYTISLDMVVNDGPVTADNASQEFTEQLLRTGWTEGQVDAVTFTAVTDSGPAGGWPVVKVTAADERTMRDLLNVYLGTDSDEVDEFMDYVTFVD